MLKRCLGGFSLETRNFFLKAASEGREQHWCFMAKSDLQTPLHDLPVDLRLLLDEIENEPVPERLLELAKELQRRLADTRKSGSNNRQRDDGPR